MFKYRKLQHDAKMIVYKEMPHGFLNYDVPSGMPQSKQCIIESAELIRDLLEKK